ncbi:uncharacterized protein LOC144222762 [Crocuta crocuta]
MRDFPWGARGTHPENAGAARGQDPLPEPRKTKRKKAYRLPALRAAATALRSSSGCRPRGTR